MNVWLLQSSEPMPVVNKEERLLRTGMLAQELVKRGHKVTWFSGTFDHFHKKHMYLKDTIIQVEENYRLNLSYAMKYKKNISVSRILNHKILAMKFKKKAKLLDKPDLIYASFPTIDYAEEAVRYGKKNNVPVIVDVRDLWPDIFYHNLPKALCILATPYIKWLDYKTRKIMREAYAINAVSKDMMNWGLNKGKRLKKKEDRYFYIGYKKQQIATLEGQEDLIDKKKFNISFFGTVNNQFDYGKIVELAKELEKQDKDIIINLCGDGPQMEELKELVKDCVNIKLLGWQGKENLNSILQNSKIGLAPYKNTFDFQMSVSNKFAEYISYGLPVVLTVEGYMKKLLEKNQCGFSSQDIKEIADFIIKIKNNSDEYMAMSVNAKKLYEEKFVAEKIYQGMVDYLEEIKEEQKK